MSAEKANIVDVEAQHNRAPSDSTTLPGDETAAPNAAKLEHERPMSMGSSSFSDISHAEVEAMDTGHQHDLEISRVCYAYTSKLVEHKTSLTSS